MGRPRRRAQNSPIDSKQKALAEQEEKLRRKMQELEQLIEKAPLVAKEAERRRKQELVIRASQPTRRAESPNSLFDKRYDATVITRRRAKSLRAEQQEARLKTLVLLVILGICLFFIWSKFIH